MRYLFIILLFISIGAFAQKPDVSSLNKAAEAFDKALVDKDSVSLNHLVSGNIFYGHSNGWIQTKKEIIGDLFNGKINYKKISALDKEEIIVIEDNTAYVKMNREVDVVMDGKPLSLKLGILQVWVWKNKHWELFARQSVKI